MELTEEIMQQVAASLIGGLCGNDEEIYEEGTNKYLGSVSVDGTWGKHGIIDGDVEINGVLHRFSMTLEMTYWVEEVW